jgi:hypothetical protein
MADKQNQGWSKETVLEDLAKSSRLRPRLHVFLEDGPADDMARLPEEIVSSADPAKSSTLGGIRKLARSFWVEGDLETLRRIAKDKHVKAILPAEVEDIFPRPVGKKRK